MKRKSVMERMAHQEELLQDCQLEESMGNRKKSPSNYLGVVLGWIRVRQLRPHSTIYPNKGR